MSVKRSQIQSDVRKTVETVIEEVTQNSNDPITPEQLTEILTKTLSSCLVSSDFIDYVETEFEKKATRKT